MCVVILQLGPHRQIQIPSACAGAGMKSKAWQETRIVFPAILLLSGFIQQSDVHSWDYKREKEMKEETQRARCQVPSPLSANAEVWEHWASLSLGAVTCVSDLSCFSRFHADCFFGLYSLIYPKVIIRSPNDKVNFYLIWEQDLFFSLGKAGSYNGKLLSFCVKPTWVQTPGGPLAVYVKLSNLFSELCFLPQ